VQFASTGGHWLAAALSTDAVDLDNRRYFACDLPAAQPVLIIDGSRDGREGRQLSLALAPGGNTRTGWQPHVEPSSFLADLDRLNEQAAVCLLDVPRLADDELSALEGYVRGGGGAAFFLGPEADRSFYNDRLYRNGDGLFPAPLKLPTQLLDRQEDTGPDIEVSQHPLFRVLSGRRNGFLPLVLIDYYYAVQDDWTPRPDSSTQVIARLRNNEPLVVEKRFGKGRVVAQLTKLSAGNTPLGQWSNWSLNPVFPVLANELVNHLSAGRQEDPLHQVGDDLAVSLDGTKYEPNVRFILPGDRAPRAEVPVDATSDGGQLTAKLGDVAASGIYQVHLQPLQGNLETREFAVNVPAGEGDLAITHREELTRQLVGVNYQLHDAADMTLDARQIAGFQMSDALLATVVLMLLAEQLLAYMASFHVPPVGGPGR
jgi:hypothetical protein